MWCGAVESMQDGTFGRTYESAPTVHGIICQQYRMDCLYRRDALGRIYKSALTVDVILFQHPYA